MPSSYPKIGDIVECVCTPCTRKEFHPDSRWVMTRRHEVVASEKLTISIQCEVCRHKATYTHVEMSKAIDRADE